MTAYQEATEYEQLVDLFVSSDDWEWVRSRSVDRADAVATHPEWYNPYGFPLH